MPRLAGGLAEVAMEASVQDPVRLIVRAIGGLGWLWLVFGIFWIAVALVVLQFDDASVKTVGVRSVRWRRRSPASPTSSASCS